ncbi:hypothetical protein ZTR_03653 [Talaromyces verruculosus]|nr:hypothetical protein ZTR_03653 [Talaromyces verruculosus]
MEANPDLNFEELFIDVQVSTQSKIIDIDPQDRLTVQGVDTFFKNVIKGKGELCMPGSIPVSGQYRIHARLSRPDLGVALPQPTVQVLVHGLLYNKSYWSGLRSAPDHLSTPYSWEKTATSRGYHVLNIDRLGCGKSTQPDPIDELQDDVQRDVLHEIYLQLRAGAIGGQKFDRIIHVGHSYGSILGSIVSDEYPDDIDHLVMTGWTYVDLPVKGNHTMSMMVSASVWKHEKYYHLSPGYFVIGDIGSKETGCFTGNYDRSLVSLDYELQDVTGLGELTSQTIVSKYKGDVFVLQGERDLALCETRDLEIMDTSEVAATKNYFPKARNVEWHILPDTGHCISLHLSAEHGANIVHDWLAKVSNSI